MHASAQRTMKAGVRFRSAGRLLAWLVLVGAMGCTHTTPVPQSPTNSQTVWPAPPEEARVAFVKSISTPADLGIKTSAIRRFGRWITGSQKGNEALLKPFAIALDENDNLCVTDTGANVVCLYNQQKRSWQRWDKVGNIRFTSPVGVAKRGEVLFVADSARGSVVAFTDNGKLRWEATNHLVRPSGLVVFQDNLFVTDAARHCVLLLDLEGRYLKEFGRRGTGPGEFNYPTHIAKNAQGSLLVTDSMNGRVEIVDPSGNYLGEVGKIGDSPGQFGRPKGVTVDSKGHVYVLDAVFDNLQIFDPSGSLLLNFGDTGYGAGQFWLPNGIAITRNNEIFVADSYNHRIQVFKYVGPL